MAIRPRREDYHASEHIDWRRAHNLVGRFIGVEYEAEPKTDGLGWDSIWAALPAHDEERDGPVPILEEDHSLSFEGLEIVFPPVASRELRKANSFVSRCIKSLGEKDAVRLTNTCGMHMNVNAAGWSEGKVAAFLCVIHTLPYAALVRLGGRRLNEYCEQKECPTLKDYDHYPEDDHQYAAEWKQGRIEVRFPKATTDVRQFRRLVYFLDYLETFAERYDGDLYDMEDDPKSSDVVKSFLRWLKGKKNVSAKDVYQTLTKSAPSKSADKAAVPPISFSSND